jgi:hypothetical protein
VIYVEKHNWTTGQREKVPVNEGVIQEMVDLLFRSTRVWETAPELFERRLRNWQGRIFAVPVPAPAPAPEPEAEPEPALVAAGVSEEPNTWREFYAHKRATKGLDMKQAAALWNARK